MTTTLIAFVASVSPVAADMTRVRVINTPHHANRFSRTKTVDIELNAAGQYAAVMPYGRNWQPTADNALAVAALVYDRPIVQGKVILVS
jgi:hypothetical protein